MPKITRLPDGTYETRISVIDPRTGKRHQPRVRARSKRDLERQIAEARVTIQRGEYIEPDRTPIRQWLDTWLEGYHPRSDASYRNRSDAVRFLKDDPIADLLLGRIQPIDVQRFVNRLSAKYAPSTVRAHYAPLKMALQSAYDLQIIPELPLRGVKIPPRTFDPRDTWDAEQVRTFIATAGKHALGSAFVLSVVLGLRIGELVGLRPTDLEWQDGRLVGCTVSRTLSHNRDSGMSVADMPKTSSSRRRLLFPRQCIDAVNHRLGHIEPLQRRLGELWDDDNALWGRDDGSHWQSNSTLRYAYYRIVADLGLPRIRPHDLRHTAATNMIWAGVPIPTVSKILGHSSPEVTMRVYAHVIAIMEDQAVRTIEDFYTPKIETSVPEKHHHESELLISRV